MGYCDGMFCKEDRCGLWVLGNLPIEIGGYKVYPDLSGMLDGISALN